MTKAQQAVLDNRNYLALSIARHLVWQIDASGAETATMPFTSQGQRYEVTVRRVADVDGQEG